MAYSEKVMDHYENPRNVGSFDITDPKVGTGMVGAPACGDVMRLQIKVDDDGIKNKPYHRRYLYCKWHGARMGRASQLCYGRAKHIFNLIPI